MNVLGPKPKIKRGFIAFFSSETGKKVAYVAAGSTTLGLFLLNWVPETFALEQYRNFVQCYKNGIPRPVPKKELDRVETATDILKLHGYERDLIKPFTVFGLDVFSAGSLKYRFGAILGIPVNYSYEKASDIAKSEIQFKGKPINWDSTAGKILQESIILTEDEKLFGISKAILEVQNFKVIMNSIFPSVSFLMVYTLGRAFNLKMNLFARHISVRLVMYSILGLFGMGSWCFMKDFNQVQTDAEVDKQLASYGPRFVQAGLSYYEKILKKNIALRELLGDDTYTSGGNVNYFIRQKSLPLTMRKAFFEQKLLEKHDPNIDTEDAVTV